jgi:hypothetical protein
VGIRNEGGNNLPGEISLSAYPNPFNSATTITYSNLKGGKVQIFDVTGQLTKSFSIGGADEGKITWDARDASGKMVSSGVYFAQARAQNGSRATKLIYLK